MTDRCSGVPGNISDPGEVFAQVQEIVRQFSPGHDLQRVESLFALLQRAFAGKLEGYAPLKTPYHNAMHTYEVVLCSARMAHGLHLGGQPLDAIHLDAVLLGALMHDFGYLMTTQEALAEGTGAQYTAVHVTRGVEYVQTCLSAHLLMPPALRETIIKVVQVTDHRQHPEWVSFDHPQQKLAAYATATADLVGQMANREYLERLLFLFLEFHEAKIPGFGDIHELMEKTADFYRVTRLRLDQHLGGLDVNLRRHFVVASGDDRNFYVDAIEQNIAYLAQLVRMPRASRLQQLRRGDIVASTLDQIENVRKN